MDNLSIAELFANGAQRFPDALCAEVDPELFFADTSQGRAMGKAQKRAAIALCGQCVHSQGDNECHQFAMDNEEWFGIFGGIDEETRRQLLRPMTALSERERLVLKFRREGFTTREVAERLNISVQLVWAAYERAQKKSAS